METIISTEHLLWTIRYVRPIETMNFYEFLGSWPLRSVCCQWLLWGIAPGTSKQKGVHVWSTYMRLRLQNTWGNDLQHWGYKLNKTNVIGKCIWEKLGTFSCILNWKTWLDVPRWQKPYLLALNRRVMFEAAKCNGFPLWSHFCSFFVCPPMLEAS